MGHLYGNSIYSTLKDLREQGATQSGRNYDQPQFRLSIPRSILFSSVDLGWQGIRVDRAVAYELAMDKQAFPVHTFSLVTGPFYGGGEGPL